MESRRPVSHRSIEARGERMAGEGREDPVCEQRSQTWISRRKTWQWRWRTRPLLDLKRSVGHLLALRRVTAGARAAQRLPRLGDPAIVLGLGRRLEVLRRVERRHAVLQGLVVFAAGPEFANLLEVGLEARRCL